MLTRCSYLHFAILSQTLQVMQLLQLQSYRYFSLKVLCAISLLYFTVQTLDQYYQMQDILILQKKHVPKHLCIHTKYTSIHMYTLQSIVLVLQDKYMKTKEHAEGEGLSEQVGKRAE